MNGTRQCNGIILTNQQLFDGVIHYQSLLTVINVFFFPAGSNDNAEIIITVQMFPTYTNYNHNRNIALKETADNVKKMYAIIVLSILPSGKICAQEMLFGIKHYESSSGYSLIKHVFDISFALR